jgi:hypothetical protein
MNTPDNIDYLFKRLRELNGDKDFYINEEGESYFLLKKLSKINLKITIIKESLISKGYNV